MVGRIEREGGNPIQGDFLRALPKGGIGVFCGARGQELPAYSDRIITLPCPSLLAHASAFTK